MTPTKALAQVNMGIASQSLLTRSVVRGIFLVEDHPIVIRGLAEVIKRESDWEVCGTAGEYSSALKEIGAVQPDLAIVGLNLKGGSGLELVKKIRTKHPQPLALVFSRHDESLYAARALRAGASGYVMKKESVQTLLLAIRTVLAGGTFLSKRMQGLGKHAVAGSGPPKLHPLGVLTDRELDIFRLIGQGKTVQEIASLLSLRMRTIGAHRTNMITKLGLRSGHQLVQAAIELNREPAPDHSESEPITESGDGIGPVKESGNY